MLIVYIILGLLLVIFVPRIGVRAAFSPEGAEVWVRVLGVSFLLYPRASKRAKPQKAEKKKRKKELEAEKRLRATKEKKKLSAGDLPALWPLTKRTLLRFFRAFHMRKLYCHLVCASQDVVATAKLYGMSQVGLGVVIPALSRKVKDLRLSSAWDYQEERPRIYLLCTVSFSPGRMLLVGLGALLGYVRYTTRKKGKN